MGDVIDLERAYKIAKELRWRKISEEVPSERGICIAMAPADNSSSQTYIMAIYEKDEWIAYGFHHYSNQQFRYWLPLSSLKVLDE